MSATNPLYRARADGRSWILKRSPDPGKDRLTAALAEHFGLAGFTVEPVEGDWLRLADLALPTLGEYVQWHGVGAALFEQLGVAAADADLLGMRDRKLGNVLIDAGPPLRAVLIDYESAFHAGLFDRIVRPGRYVRYLVTRLYLDVLHHAGAAEAGAAEQDAWFAAFRRGMVAECRRLNGIRGPLPPMTLRQRLTLATRRRDERRMAALLDRARRRAVGKFKPRNP